MRPILSVCRVALLLLMGGAAGLAQSTLPPMRPTAREKVIHPPTVAFASGELEIRAENSSLNEILRDVARKIGMKITGAVVDEPVYGNFGPSAPAVVLANLLDGTSSNMLFVEAANRRGSGELILTPRQDTSIAATSGQETQSPQNEPAADSQPALELQEISAASMPSSEADVAQSPATVDAVSKDTSSQPDASNEKSPIEIYQQLQKLQAARSRKSTPR